MTRTDLISRLYQRRDQRPRGSAGWTDLDRAVLLIDRAWGGSVVTEAELRHAVALVTMHAPELALDVQTLVTR